MNRNAENQNFLNSVGIASFVLGLMNYQENLTQNDKQEIMQNSSQVSDAIITKIDQHLQIQDRKIDEILELLKK